MPEKLKSGNWRARFRVKNQRVTGPTFSKKVDALKWEQLQRTKYLMGDLNPEIGKTSISEPLHGFLLKLKQRSKISHFKHKSGVICKFIDSYQIETVDDYTEEFVLDFQGSNQKAPNTKKKEVQFVVSFGNFLHEKGFHKENRMKSIENPNKVPFVKRRRCLKIEELEHLFESIKRNRPSIYLLCKFIALQGLRKMEAVTLEGDNILLEHGELRIFNKPYLEIRPGESFTCKWGSERALPLSDESIEILESLRPKQGEIIFKNNLGSMFRNNLLRDFKTAVFRSDLVRPDEINIHSLRHTWISHALKNGLNIKTVSDYAGHKNLTTTQGYVHSLKRPEEMREDQRMFVGFKGLSHIRPTLKINSEADKVKGFLNDYKIKD